MTTTLLADVGGTNVRFALADTEAAQPLVEDSIRRYRVADFAGFADAARRYLDDAGARVTRGVFAFAGPVVGDEVRLTNHPWTTSLEGTRAALGLDGVRGLNDFAAMSLSLTLLDDAHVEVLGGIAPRAPGDAAHQTFAIAGPGTGLGVGALLVRDGRVLTLDTEGGHLSFAPRTAHEIEILRVLTERFGRVSNERLLCGSGLVNLYHALGTIDGVATEALEPADVTLRAQHGDDALCVRAVEGFCEMLGAAAGDLVLAFGAWDGVYLTGGLTPRLRAWFHSEAFRRRFEDKGRFAARMAQVPTVAVLHHDAGLLGTAAQAVLDAGLVLVPRRRVG
ncbi:glucokinase [Dokdonella sp. MW10]|uniref:glucokinase n=1 Tax=Dokdonella sp. MW10 TaxID=2992926 RepID=UPI003F7ECB99